MSYPKRFLFLMPTSSIAGGVETWLDEIYEYLTTHQFEVLVGLLRGQQFNQPERYRAVHPQLKTIEVDGRGCNREGRVRALMRCIEGVNPDIVIPLGIADAYEAGIRSKQKGLDTRLVIHAQGNLEPMLADLRSYRDGIDQVICPGELTKRVLINWGGFASDRVAHIPNGANQPIYNSQSPISSGNAKLIRIGYIGRLTTLDKRSPDLITLYEELEKLNLNYQLDIVGDGPCFAQLNEALGKAPQVKLHGALSREAVYQEIFPNLDVLILLSSSEAFGIVIVEALMHGVIPVTSRYVGFYAEGLVKENETGLSFPVGDMAGAAQQIQRLAEDGDLRHRLSSNGQVHGQPYTWESSLTSWKMALEQVMARPPLLSSSPLPKIPTTTGRLEQLGIPASVIDGLRRLRRFLLGSPIPPGGEEWPLFYRHHSESLLEEISQVLKDLDTAE